MSWELAVLLAGGMYGWMSAWLSCPVEAGGGYRGLEKGVGGGINTNKTGQVLFSGIRATLVNILATMSLEKVKEKRI